MGNPDQERIDQYLRNELSSKDRQAFEALLNTDFDLKKEVAAQRDAHILSRSMGDYQLKATIQRAVEKAEQQATEKKNGISPVAIFLILLGLALALFFYLSPADSPIQKESPPMALIYQDNYQALDLTFGKRGAEELLSAASIAYQERDFQKALSLFEQTNASQKDPKIRLGMAICLIELDRHDSAEQMLSTTLDDPLVGNKTRWYFALLLLKKEDPQALQEFEILAQTPGAYQQAAAQAIVQLLKK